MSTIIRPDYEEDVSQQIYHESCSHCWNPISYCVCEPKICRYCGIDFRGRLFCKCDESTKANDELVKRVIEEKRKIKEKEPRDYVLGDDINNC